MSDIDVEALIGLAKSGAAPAGEPQGPPQPVPYFGYDAHPDDLVAEAQAEQRRRTRPLNLAAMGYPDLTAADLAELQEYGASSRGVEIGKRHIPAVGGFAEVDQVLEDAETEIRWRSGTADREQQKRHLRMRLEGERPQSFAAGFGQMAVDSLAVGADIALGAATGGVGAGGAMARLGARVGFKAGARRLTAKAAQIGGTATSATALREVGGRVVGEGGHSTAASMQRALPELLADDEAMEALAEANDRVVDEKIIGDLLDRHPLWKGLSEEMLSISVETGGGLLLGKLPPMEIFRALPITLLRRAGIKNPEDAFRFLRNTAGINDGLTELAEEVLEGAAVEGAFGEGPLGERLLSGVPSTLTETAQIMLLGTLVPSVAAVVGNAFKARDEARARTLAEQQESPSGRKGPGGESETSSGGDSSTPVSATAATADVAPGISPEQREANFRRFFGKSATVDESGLPLTLYHGTIHEFREFQQDLRDGGQVLDGHYGRGFYLTGQQSEANFYANLRGDGDSARQIMPLYASVQNPVVIDIADPAATKADLLSLDGWTEEERAIIQRDPDIAQVISGVRQREVYEANGKDGVIVHEFIDGKPQRFREVVVFRPEQIKSALGNSGRFDPNSADIADRDAEPAVTAREGPGVFTPAEPEAVEAFAQAAEITNAAQIEPQTPEQVEAVELARSYGREVVLVSGEGNARRSGMIDAQGRMFVDANAASPRAVALHEIAHDLADTLGEGEFRAELGRLEEVAPGLVDRYARAWARRREADPTDTEGPATPELAQEEGFASLVEENAALVAYASTRQGAKDMRAVAEHSPTVFRRMVDSVRRFAGRASAETAALDRIQAATRQRPDQAAAQLATYLADLFERGLRRREAGGQAGAAEKGTAASSAIRDPDATPKPALQEPQDSTEQPPRSERNNPLATPGTRALGDMVDANRSAEGRPDQRSRAEDRAFAEEQLRADYDGTRSEIEAKLETGERLQTWELHALNEINEQLAAASLRGEPGALADFTKLFDAYREERAESGRNLGAMVGVGRPAHLAIMEMIATPSRENRRKLADIKRELDGAMRLLSPFKSSSARYLKTHHQQQQERRGNRFAPNRRMRDNFGVLDEFGKPLTEARIEALERQREKVEADEERRMAKAREAVRALGYDLDGMDIADVAARDMWMVRNAISVAKANWLDKVLEYRYMSMLSGIATQARNTAGNVTMMAVDGPILKVAEATANLAVRDPDSASFGELPHWFGGFLSALRPAFRNMLDAWRTQGPAFELELQDAGADMGVYEFNPGTKLDYVPGPKTGGRLARALRTVSLNTLLASDEFFKTIAATAEVHSLAYREAKKEGLEGTALRDRMQELVDDKSSPVWTQALYKAREVTFQDEGGKASQKVADVLNNIVGSADYIGETYARTPIGTLLIPFRKTPVRIAARALRLTPLQSLMIPSKAIFSKEYQGNRGALVRDLADAMMAWGLTLSILQLLELEDDEGRPFITGARSSNRAEASLDYATAPPMSVRVAGRYLDYSRAEPFATGLGMLVAMGEAFRRDGTGASLQAMLQASVAQTKDKTFLRTIGEVMELADSSRTTEDRALGFLRNTFVTPLVPNIVRQTVRETDDVLRERRKLSDGKAAFWLDGIYASPGDSLAELTGAERRGVRHDAWGRPIQKSYARKGFSDAIYRMLSPLQPKLDLDETSKLDLALLAWERKVTSGDVEGEGARIYYPSRPRRTFKVDGEEYEMSQREYERYTRDGGAEAARRILADRSINLEDPAERDIDAIRKHVNKARGEIRDAIRGEVRERMRATTAGASGRGTR